MSEAANPHCCSVQGEAWLSCMCPGQQGLCGLVREGTISWKESSRQRGKDCAEPGSCIQGAAGRATGSTAPEEGAF